MGAPLGTAGLYIKADRLADIAPHMGNTPEHDIRSRVFPGTTNFAATVTVPDALAFQDALGGNFNEWPSGRSSGRHDHWWALGTCSLARPRRLRARAG